MKKTLLTRIRDKFYQNLESQEYHHILSVKNLYELAVIEAVIEQELATPEYERMQNVQRTH